MLQEGRSCIRSVIGVKTFREIGAQLSRTPGASLETFTTHGMRLMVVALAMEIVLGIANCLVSIAW
jgi:hypothetical protein